VLGVGLAPHGAMQRCNSTGALSQQPLRGTSQK
jgi:hypothetical protein